MFDFSGNKSNKVHVSDNNKSDLKNNYEILPEKRKPQFEYEHVTQTNFNQNNVKKHDLKPKNSKGKPDIIKQNINKIKEKSLTKNVSPNPIEKNLKIKDQEKKYNMNTKNNDLKYIGPKILKPTIKNNEKTLSDLESGSDNEVQLKYNSSVVSNSNYVSNFFSNFKFKSPVTKEDLEY